MEFLLEQSAKHDAQLAKLIRVTNQDAENIRSLARVAEAHEKRLRRIERGRRNKERNRSSSPAAQPLRMRF